LRQELESQYKRGKLSLKDVQPHDAATLLKQFLRELPTPLLTFEYLDAFAQVNSMLHRTVLFLLSAARSSRCRMMNDAMRGKVEFTVTKSIYLKLFWHFVHLV